MINYQNEIEWAISDTGRTGYQNVIEWLREVRFYDIPASVRWHNNYRGGLAKHSWQVFQEALKLASNENIPLQSLALCALLHDVCKFDKYRLDRYGNPIRTNVADKDQHGLYSVELLKRLGLQLYDNEKQAIWWHMGINEPSLEQNREKYQQSLNDPLCNIIRTADGIASHSWYAEPWIEEFEVARQHRQTHPLLQQVFKSTLSLTAGSYYISHSGKSVQLNLNSNAHRDNVFCENEIALINPVHQYHTDIHVIEQDCLACAHDMLSSDSTDDLCVLNMASSKNPGGGVLGGAGAQEEYLFRCSDYYRFLYQYASSFDSYAHYHIRQNPRHRYPLGEFGGIFSHGITVFRDTQAKGYRLIDTPWHVNFVAVAAYHLDRKTDQIPISKLDGTMRKIRAILRIAYNNGQRRLVLGAFGCGAFNNPPKQMAELFRQVIEEPEFKGIFRQIVFAIIEDHNSKGINYEAFCEVFNKKQLL